MSGTIADWEARRFSEEAFTDISALSTIEPERAIQAHDANVPDGLQCWAGRSDNGFHVQGLVAPDGRTFISCALNGAYETIEVPRARAADAFTHPFAYGCTLDL